MATIANLVVKLSTNTKGFERGMNRSKKKLKGFSAGELTDGPLMIYSDFAIGSP